MSIGVVASISLTALQHNLSVVRALCPQQKICAMVKANAYGHGLASCLKVLKQSDALGVANLDEALWVQQLQPGVPVFIMRGFLSSDEYQVMQQHQIAAVLHDWQQVEMLKDLPVGPALPVWIKLDTGMHRLGFDLEDVEKLQRLASDYRITILGWMTHLAMADEQVSGFTQQQLQRFEAALAHVSGDRCIANSAAILTAPEARGDWVRPGLMLYGISPFSHQTAADLGLQPVMTVTAPIVAIKTVKAGESVGYGQIWTADKDTSLAVIGMGYGDGYPREVNQARVSVLGELCPVVGRVSMDMMAVDLTPLQGRLPALGDRVCIWGAENPVEALAKAAQTIPYTLITRLTDRVRFVEEVA